MFTVHPPVRQDSVLIYGNDFYCTFTPKKIIRKMIEKTGNNGIGKECINTKRYLR
jgi:hypothetical protein